MNIPYKTILFDMDGTVLNTLSGLTRSLNYILCRHGLPTLTPEQVRPKLGHGYAGLIGSAVGAALSKTDQAALIQEFAAYYSQHCNQGVSPYEGIPELLAQLRQAGCRTAIVSNKGQAAVQSLCQRFFPGQLDLAVGEHEGCRRKPAPDMVWEALRQLNCPKEEAVYIGDSEVDLQTADQAGMDVILVSWGFRDLPFLKSLHPHCLFRTTEELKAFLLPSSLTADI